jgi:hypothetical protein
VGRVAPPGVCWTQWQSGRKRSRVKLAQIDARRRAMASGAGDRTGSSLLLLNKLFGNFDVSAGDLLLEHAASLTRRDLRVDSRVQRSMHRDQVALPDELVQLDVVRRGRAVRVRVRSG